MRTALVLLLCVVVAVSAQPKPGQPIKSNAPKAGAKAANPLPLPPKPTAVKPTATTVKPPTTTTTATTPATKPKGKPAVGEACKVATSKGVSNGYCRLPTNCGINSKRYVAGICAGGVVCCVEQQPPHGAACPAARRAFGYTGSLKSGLDEYCKKVHKQSAATCDQRVEKKLVLLRAAINGACNKSPSAPKPAPQAAVSRGAMVETAAGVEGDGLINRLADYFVQKAAGITKAEANAGCNFQNKMNCRAYVTNCAMECMGESMATCKSCMNSYSGHPASTFEKCCPCTDIVGQFGITSCNY